MGLAGWRFNDADCKFVIAVATHFRTGILIGVMALWALDIKNFIHPAAHLVFMVLFGRWLRSLGGIPADRTQAWPGQ
jgi:1-acyl-sn-glycerol-3-phosphate acyltransferase